MIPGLVIITGLPCSGKSTIAGRIGVEFGLPVVSKDGIKERLFDSLGWKDRAWSRRLSAASYELLFYVAELELASGRSLALEANFDAARHTPRFTALQQAYPCRTFQVLCKAQGEILVERFQQRAEAGRRHPGHVDREAFEELRPQLIQGRTEPLQIGAPLLEVNTSDFTEVDFPRIFSAISLSLELPSRDPPGRT